jgi:hypothetical protein
LGTGIDDGAAPRERAARRAALPHFGVCGGCKLQHLDVSVQIATKQRALEDALWHLGKVRPERMLRAIEGPSWGYRYRARLSVRNVQKKGKVLVGFHERKSSYVADMDSCEVLPPHVSRLLVPLAELIAAMDQRDRLPQIELAVGSRVTALVLRPPRAALPRRPRAAAGVCRDARHPVVAPTQGPGHGTSAGSGRRAARLHAAGVRHHDALQADRLHAGEPPDQHGARRACAAAARRAAARARHRLVLRPRATSRCPLRRRRARCSASKAAMRS